MGRKQQQSSSSSSSTSFWHPRRRSSSAPATPREPAADPPPFGCMSMVHYLIFAPGAGCVGRPPAAVVAPRANNSYHHQHEDDVAGQRRRDGAEEETNSKGGFEAPRNSLDLDADSLNDIQIGVQVEPVFDALACRKMGRGRATAPSSEAETPRTPSLVARLMGIDGLPESSTNQSPAAEKKKKKPTAAATTTTPAAEKKKRVIPESITTRREPLRSLSCNTVVQSLPETPRGSSARASWDGARMSLQALKENVLDRAAQYMSLPTSPTSRSAGSNGKKERKKRSNNKSAEERERAAKEIVRQAKETVASRKLQAKEQQQRSDNKENVSPVPPVRKDKLLAVVAHREGNKQVPSPPPPTTTKSPPPQRRVALAPKHPNQQPPPPPQRAKPSRPPPPPPPLLMDATPSCRARKPDGCERFVNSIKKPAAAAAPLPPSPPRNQTTSPSPSTRAAPAASPVAPYSRSRRVSPPREEDPEYRYLRTVLERGGFMSSTASRIRRPFRGHSVASPVDPIVFHLLELELPSDLELERLGPLRHRWNRKLMFHLAQEILAGLILGLDSDGASSVVSGTGRTTTAELPRGAPLLARVWKRVRSFPAADCRVVGDIDALVATDLSESAAGVRRHPAVAEEAGDVAEEVAERVLETLIGEYVAEESLILSPPRPSASRAQHR